MNYAGATASYALSGVSQPIWYTAQDYTGKYALVGSGNFPSTVDDVWLSTDYGATFNTIIPNVFSFAGAISGNGQYMLAGYVTGGGQGSYLSSDYGATFNNLTSLQTLLLTNANIGQTGNYMLVTTDSATASRVRQSSDFGTTFNAPPSPIPAAYTPYSTACTMSSDGKYRFINPDPRYGFTTMYRSDDYGVTYTATTALPTPNSGTFYLRYSVSASGQYQSAIVFNYSTTAYISNNYGVSFTTTSFPSNIQSAAISGSGQYFGFVLSTGAVYISNNFGKTFINLFKHPNAPHDKALSMSYNGDYMMVGGNSTALTLYKGYGSMYSSLLLNFVFAKNV